MDSRQTALDSFKHMLLRTVCGAVDEAEAPSDALAYLDTAAEHRVQANCTCFYKHMLIRVVCDAVDEAEAPFEAPADVDTAADQLEL